MSRAQRLEHLDYNERLTELAWEKEGLMRTQQQPLNTCKEVIRRQSQAIPSSAWCEYTSKCIKSKKRGLDWRRLLSHTQTHHHEENKAVEQITHRGGVVFIFAGFQDLTKS